MFRQLVERHYDVLYRRFVSRGLSLADAEDLAQKVWLQVFQHIGNYDAQGRFPHYLSTIASNLMKTHWRDTGTRQAVIASSDTREDGSVMEAVTEINPEDRSAADESAAYLTQTLIPSLPVEQRMAWLLRHESEYWEPERPFTWSHMAEMNGMDEQQAWATFESAREKFMCAGRAPDLEPPDADETSVFLVWTQAQRAGKQQRFTCDYFARLLNVPENTMKTRYRAAEKALRKGLQHFRSVSA